MLKFNRNKLVTVQRLGDGTLRIHGVLEDTIYAMELDLDVSIPELEIKHIDGKMNRVTTPGCSKATPRLQRAVGICLEPGFSSRVKRLIGREGCRHYANLLLECMDAVVPALISALWKELKEANPGMNAQEFRLKVIEKYPPVEDKLRAYAIA